MAGPLDERAGAPTDRIVYPYSRSVGKNCPHHRPGTGHIIGSRTTNSAHHCRRNVDLMKWAGEAGSAVEHPIGYTSYTPNADAWPAEMAEEDNRSCIAGTQSAN